MKAVWVNRIGIARRDGITPDLEVTTLAECASRLTEVRSCDTLTEKQNDPYHGE